MKSTRLLLILLGCSLLNFRAWSQDTNTENQIAAALLAAPEEGRADAHVYGYNGKGEFVTLRKGTNEFICIADNPNKEGFEVVSYHRDLEPFMARGRELRTEGKNFSERGQIREEEARSGKLKMPEKPTTLHIYYGKDARYDAASKSITGASYRYVVYIPFATQESTGLSLKPNGPGHPWLMDPGKHNAHIMITPPAKN